MLCVYIVLLKGWLLTRIINGYSWCITQISCYWHAFNSKKICRSHIAWLKEIFGFNLEISFESIKKLEIRNKTISESIYYSKSKKDSKEMFLYFLTMLGNLIFIIFFNRNNKKINDVVWRKITIKWRMNNSTKVLQQGLSNSCRTCLPFLRQVPLKCDFQ